MGRLRPKKKAPPPFTWWITCGGANGEPCPEFNKVGVVVRRGIPDFEAFVDGLASAAGWVLGLTGVTVHLTGGAATEAPRGQEFLCPACGLVVVDGVLAGPMPPATRRLIEETREFLEVHRACSKACDEVGDEAEEAPTWRSTNSAT